MGSSATTEGAGAWGVSVVIPAHNRAHTLGYCLDSVLAQTSPAAEVIVVDDASTDDTAGLVQSYAHRGVRYLRLEGGTGAQAARNAGVRAAAGPWVAFQDSDDIWLPDKLALQLKALQERGDGPCWVVHGDGWKREADSTELAPLCVPRTEGQCMSELLLRPAPLFPALLTSKAALQACGLLDEACPAYQEWETSLRLARVCRFIHLQVPLFIWVWHRQQTISKDPQRAVQGFNHVLDRYRDDILRVHGPRVWRQQKLSQVAVAMRAGLWVQAQAIADSAGHHPALSLARALCRLRLAPRGIGRLFRALG